MLFTSGQKKKISTGEMTVTFRGWATSQATAGKAYTFDVQRSLYVDAVDLVPAGSIDDAEAVRAGEVSSVAMRAMLNRTSRREIGDADLVYRVAFHLGELAPKKALLPAKVIVEKLRAIDARSTKGPWTRDYLQMIADGPRVGAKIHAARRGEETLVLKADVRKLKALGLTVSFEVGYRLTELGEEVLGMVRAR